MFHLFGYLILIITSFIGAWCLLNQIDDLTEQRKKLRRENAGLRELLQLAEVDKFLNEMIDEKLTLEAEGFVEE